MFSRLVTLYAEDAMCVDSREVTVMEKLIMNFDRYIIYRMHFKKTTLKLSNMQLFFERNEFQHHDVVITHLILKTLTIC